MGFTEPGTGFEGLERSRQPVERDLTLQRTEIGLADQQRIVETAELLACRDRIKEEFIHFGG
jgi:hypothetical protein